MRLCLLIIVMIARIIIFILRIVKRLSTKAGQSGHDSHPALEESPEPISHQWVPPWPSSCIFNRPLRLIRPMKDK